jgi:hypothetical protein
MMYYYNSTSLADAPESQRISVSDRPESPAAPNRGYIITLRLRYNVLEKPKCQ